MFSLLKLGELFKNASLETSITLEKLIWYHSPNLVPSDGENGHHQPGKTRVGCNHFVHSWQGLAAAYSWPRSLTPPLLDRRHSTCCCCRRVRHWRHQVTLSRHKKTVHVSYSWQKCPKAKIIFSSVKDGTLIIEGDSSCEVTLCGITQEEWGGFLGRVLRE